MNISVDEIQNWLKERNINFNINLNLKTRSWIKAGGVVKTFIQPNSTNQCEEIIKYFSKKKIDFYVLGNQSNIIIRDGIILTPIINFSILSKLLLDKTSDGLIITCGSGVSIPRFSKNITQNGFTGAEGILGIPGTVGGGICMNASSYNSYLCSFLKKTKLIDQDGKIFTLNKDELKLRWRGSLVKDKRYIVLECQFFVPQKNYIGEHKTKEISNNILNHRRFYQENDLPNLGSIFATKNIYKDLSKISSLFIFLYFVYKAGTFFFIKYNKKNLLIFRKFIISLYLKALGLQKFKQFTASTKTLNCLVNKGSDEAKNAIIFLKKFKTKTNKILEMENVILEDIL